jgi:hypothetical protein
LAAAARVICLGSGGHDPVSGVRRRPGGSRAVVGYALATRRRGGGAGLLGSGGCRAVYCRRLLVGLVLRRGGQGGDLDVQAPEFCLGGREGVLVPERLGQFLLGACDVVLVGGDVGDELVAYLFDP